MNNITIAEIIITHGKNRYKANIESNQIHWSVLLWGWWPNGGDIPSYRWEKVDNVPKEVEEELENWRNR